MDFGKTPDGTPVELYVLTNGRITAKVITYGGIVTELHVPDRRRQDGRRRPRLRHARGLPGQQPALRGHHRPGRQPDRQGKFTLDGKEYKLAANNGRNTLHGGLKGFDKVVWKAEDVSGAGRARPSS